jgi:metal-responsive CopG/Arc/MetJ family transcriptional regulator
MYENMPVGIRLPKKTLEMLSEIEEEEGEDRSTIARKMLFRGLEEYRKEKALKKYAAGKISISEAAKHAGMNLWEFGVYALAHGFKSSYSIDDLEGELK